MEKNKKYKMLIFTAVFKLVKHGEKPCSYIYIYM
jgi:hypothetical protein